MVLQLFNLSEYKITNYSRISVVSESYKHVQMDDTFMIEIVYGPPHEHIDDLHRLNLRDCF